MSCNGLKVSRDKAQWMFFAHSSLRPDALCLSLSDCKSFTLVIVAHSSFYYLRIMHSGLPGSLKKETFGPKLHLLQ